MMDVSCWAVVDNGLTIRTHISYDYSLDRANKTSLKRFSGGVGCRDLDVPLVRN